MIGPFRYCSHMKVKLNPAVLSSNNNSLGQAFSGIVGRAQYSKDKKCCKDTIQPDAATKKIESWPKNEPPLQPWRAECPQDPQPPNYDPYRIKVPEVVVPPLPPSNVKRSGVVFTTTDQPPGREELSPHRHQNPQHSYQPAAPEQTEAPPEEEDKSFLGLLKGFFGKFKGKKGDGDAMMNNNREDIQSEDVKELFRQPGFSFHASSSVQDLFHNSPIVHPDYWKAKPAKKLTEVVKDVLPKLGYHGKNKYKYAFHEPWKPLDRITLLQQAEQQELEESDDALIKREN